MGKVFIGVIIGVFLTGFYSIYRDISNPEIEFPNNHVAVRLEIDTTKEIDEVNLKSTKSEQKIKLSRQKKTILIFPNAGEGEFHVCCKFKDGNEICSRNDYIERGYTPKLKITDNKIETIDPY